MVAMCASPLWSGWALVAHMRAGLHQICTMRSGEKWKRHVVARCPRGQPGSYGSPSPGRDARFRQQPYLSLPLEGKSVMDCKAHGSINAPGYRVKSEKNRRIG